MRLFDLAEAEGHHHLGYNGPEEDAYCREFASALGGGFADGVNSGTSAVFVALLALDLKPGGEIIVPPITDPGGVMPVALLGHTAVTADAAPGSYNMSATQIAARITDQTRAILVAHLAGLPADMDPILELARQRGIPVVEDCAQSHGAMYKGKPVGGLGTIACYSTMFGKHHASGGQGGLVFTRDEPLYWQVRRAADRGKPFGIQGSSGNLFASLNLNMDELHAAIGRTQLARLPAMVRQRRKLAATLAGRCREELRTVRLVTDPPGCEASYWFLFFCFDPAPLRATKTEFVAAVAAEGIPVEPGYPFVQSRQPWWARTFPDAGPERYPLPNIDAAEACHFRCLFHEDWTETEIDDFMAAMTKVEAAFAR